MISNIDILSRTLGFPDSSVGKEYACNGGDPGLIPGSGRSTGEGIDYPLQYCSASLVAQLAKNPPAIRETWNSGYSQFSVIFDCKAGWFTFAF